MVSYRLVRFAISVIWEIMGRWRLAGWNGELVDYSTVLLGKLGLGLQYMVALVQIHTHPPTHYLHLIQVGIAQKVGIACNISRMSPQPHFHPCRPSLAPSAYCKDPGSLFPLWMWPTPTTPAPHHHLDAEVDAFVPSRHGWNLSDRRRHFHLFSFRTKTPNDIVLLVGKYI